MKRHRSDSPGSLAPLPRLPYASLLFSYQNGPDHGVHQPGTRRASGRTYFVTPTTSRPSEVGDGSAASIEAVLRSHSRLRWHRSSRACGVPALRRHTAFVEGWGSTVKAGESWPHADRTAVRSAHLRKWRAIRSVIGHRNLRWDGPASRRSTTSKPTPPDGARITVELIVTSRKASARPTRSRAQDQELRAYSRDIRRPVDVRAFP